MRSFTFLCIWMFLAIFVKGHAHASVCEFEKKKGHSSKEVKINQKINSDEQDEDSDHWRKRKPRGIEVDVPKISVISFEQHFDYKTFHLLWTERRHSPLFHCVHPKRGPPLN